MPEIVTSQSRVRFDEARCQNSGCCGLRLSRMIQALSGEAGSGDDADEEMLKAAAAACPSGALSYSKRRRVRAKEQVRERRFYLP